MAIPVVTNQQITKGIVEALQRLPAIKKDEMFIQPIVDPFKPLPIKAPVVRPQQEVRTILPVLTPPISKEVIIAPPMALQTSSVLPLLVAGAILLMQ